MINIKTQMVSALKNDPELSEILGGKSVYFQMAPETKADEFPRITYYEIENSGAVYADDEETESEIHMVIDIWDKPVGNRELKNSQIAGQVDKILGLIGFYRESSIDLFENDTKIYHKSMRFVTSKGVE